jgi:hypothetical protein
MRVPKPRLRQVFEHTTSFKVQKPGGQTITIAKKGLSPSTVGRLRRFAQGGEVRGYDNGGDVTPEEPIDARMPEIAPEALAPQTTTEEVDIPRTSRRVVTQAMIDEEVRRQAAATAAPAPAVMAPVTAPAAPAPVVVNVNAAPQPTAQNTEVAPVAEKKTDEAPAVEEKTQEQAPEKATEQQPAVPLQKTEPSQAVSGLPTIDVVSQPEPGYVAPAPPAKLQSTAGAPSSVAIARPAITSVPVAAPVLPAAVTPKLPSVAASAPRVAEPLQTLVAPTVSKTPAAAAASVVPVAAPTGPMAPAPTQAPDILSDEQIDALVAPAPERYRPALKMAMQSQRNTELADRQLRAQQVSAVKMEEDRTRAAAELAKNKVEEVRNKKYDILSQLEAARQEGTFFSKMPALEKIGTILMMGVSGYLSGYSGVPNYALDAFNKALARDIERQRQKSQGLLVELKAMTGSEQVAEQMYRGIAKEAISIEAKRQEMQASSDKARSAYGAVSAKFALDAYKDFADIDQKVADTAYTEARRLGELTAAEKLAIEASKAAARERIANLEQERIRESARAHRAAEKAARENAADKDDLDRQARTLNAGGIGLLMPRKAQGTKVQQQLMFRNQGIRAIDSAIDLLDKANNVNLATKNSDEYIAATALVKSLKESYAGLAQGSERAISLNAAKVVEEALQSPTSLTRLVLGQKTTALRELRREFDGARTGFVRSMTLPGENVDAAIKALHEEDSFISGVSADKLIDFQPGAK